MQVQLKTRSQLEKMRTAGKLAAEVLEMIEPYVKPGISTGELDTLCHRHIVDKQQAIPAALNYKGFPKSICTSVNQVVCHGIPDEQKILKSGDIINIDVAVIKDGWYGDTSKMFAVGKTPPYATKLVEFTQLCLYEAMALVKPGLKLGDLGFQIMQMAQSQHYSVVKDFCGHGIGQNFHEEPQVLHYGLPDTGLELKEGMTFTIEPMLNLGTHKVLIDPGDGWTVRTFDGKLSAQWEHTLAVTATGCEVLTARREEDLHFLS